MEPMNELTMEMVLEIFQDYIEEHENLDVCRTKFGYAMLHFMPERGEFYGVPQIMKTPDELAENLLEEIVLDVLKDTDHDLDDATEEELEEIKKRQGVYREKIEKLSQS